MSENIPYSKHFLDNDDIDAVVDVLKNRNITQGTDVEKFEKDIAEYVGAKYAVAMSSWTSGLHMAYLALGVNKTNTIITSPITFVSTANASLFCGALPCFADIDDSTINICPDRIEEQLKRNPNIKVIVPVHFAGAPCDMEKINFIAKKHGAYVVEDAAHALGAKNFDGSKVGSCSYSDMCGFSFHPVKSIAAGEGGMITTNNKNFYRKLLRLRSHGINKLDDTLMNHSSAYTGKLKNPWYYEMQELGFNYRITDIQCALGRSQLKKLDNFLNKRYELALRYDDAFKNLKYINPIHESLRQFSSHHLYVLKINFSKLGTTRADFVNHLNQNNIYPQVHYIPVTSHPFYEEMGFKTSNYDYTKNYYDQAISIPLYFGLSFSDQDKVINIIKSFFKDKLT